ncbi:flagellar export chaperone FlgN [Phycisphaerales bacterium AB-hyl4]|uniref:Flagellar export chaperone FlgN n=1 Tax=Natronomicrosphaera hydrolytica TaxID=3242702 RepID=A0ABV4U4V8_9BACT
MTQPSPIADMSIAPLVEKLTQQRDHYAQLKQLADRQAALIAEGETEQLLGVLAQRQQLVDELGRLSEEIAPYRERWAQLSASLGDGDRQRVNALIESVEGLIEQIIEQDDRDRQQLQTAREQVGNQVKQVHHAGRAVNAYRAAPVAGPGARFTDRRG